MRFLEIFVLFCLLQESPALSTDEVNEIDMNFVQVAHTGREPGLRLSCNDESIELKQWAGELLTAMQGVAQLLDDAYDCDNYTESLTRQIDCVLDPAMTTSARMLNEMRENNEGFFHFAKRMSLEHHNYFNTLTLAEDRKHLFEQAANDSIALQLGIEADDTTDFDEYLRRYFAQ